MFDLFNPAFGFNRGGKIAQVAFHFLNVCFMGDMDEWIFYTPERSHHPGATGHPCLQWWSEAAGQSAQIFFLFQQLNFMPLRAMDKAQVMPAIPPPTTRAVLLTGRSNSLSGF